MKIIQVLTLLILFNAVVLQSLAQNKSADLCKNLHTLLRFVAIEKPSDSVNKSKLRDSVKGMPTLLNIQYQSRILISTLADQSNLVAGNGDDWSFNGTIQAVNSLQPATPYIAERIDKIVACLRAEGYGPTNKVDTSGMMLLDYFKGNINVNVRYLSRDNNMFDAVIFITRTDVDEYGW